MTVRVASAAESSSIDQSAIAGGIASRALMRVAASNAAAVIASRAAGSLRDGVVVFTGPGNNGGDGWAVAAALHRAGVRVSVRAVVPVRSADARAERDLAAALGVPTADAPASAGVVVDALLGTGATGSPRGAVADAVREIAAMRVGGAFVVALDVPTGLDASTGAVGDPSLRADLTIQFGTAKRGTLVRRAPCGALVVVDIGLPLHGESLPTLVDAAFVRAHVPPIAPDAHKGTRRSVAIVAGARSMGGAALHAAEGALRSGAGLVKVVTDAANVPAVNARIPSALTGTLDDAAAAIREWADAVVIGPGLGQDDAARAVVHDILATWTGPTVLDADALNIFDGDLGALARALGGRPAVLTPHPAELARLVGRSVADVLASRFDVGSELAVRVGAAVLLKGTPSVASDPAGIRRVSATGTAVLATGGSGDLLSGMIATLLAQELSPIDAAACAAWVHGRAAELTCGVRGATLEDVVQHLTQAWRAEWTPAYPALAELPVLGIGE